MRKTLLVVTGLCCFAPVIVSTSTLAQDADIRAVYVKGNEIYTSSGSSGEVRRITNDGARKSLPVWSKDGARIAFVESVDGVRALGYLVVIDNDGNVSNRIPFRSEPDSAGGMRFIEHLEWLAGDRIAVSGSANPSLTETAIVDLATGSEQSGIFDDGPGADFSPDGRHFAYTSGAPHFTSEDHRRPALEVDYVRVFPNPRRHVKFVSPRRWSPDSSRVAVVAEDFTTKRQSVVVWSREGKVLETTLTLPAGSASDLFWSGGDVVVTSPRGNLRITTATGSVEAVSAGELLNPLQQARSERRRLLDIFLRDGDREADFWCQSCILTALPRRVQADND